MATVHKKRLSNGKLSENYYASYRIPTTGGGTRQVKKATGHSTKKEALAVANQLEREALAEAGAGDKNGEAILSRVREAGELALKGRLNPSHARRLIGEIMEISGQGSLREQSCREWFAEWLQEKKVTTKPSTVAFYRTVTKDFLAFMGERADQHLETVTASDVRSYRDLQVSEGKTGKTANHKLKCLRSIFRDAVKASVILQNPADSVKQVNETDSTPREPFTIDEVKSLVTASPSSDWMGVILLGVFAGLRLTDCATIKAGNIDLERGVIQIKPKKTERKGQVLEIPMHAELLAFFKENPPPAFKANPVFDSLARVTSGGRKGLSARFKEIMENAGVERNVTRRTEDGAARETASRSFHSLRHTFTSMLANAQVPEEVRKKMTGHTESTTHQIYTHLELETLRDGVDSIPSLREWA